MKYVQALLIISIIVFGIGSDIPLASGQDELSEDAANLIGTWRLVSMEGGTESQRAGFGSDPQGLIYYDNTGHMAAQLMPDRSRAKWEYGKDPTPEQAKDALTGYAAYFGKYSINKEERTVTHHRIGNIRPGSPVDVTRQYIFITGDKVVLKPVEKVYGTLALTWERIK